MFVYDGDVAYSFFVTSANGGNKNETLVERRKQTNRTSVCEQTEDGQRRVGC